MIDRPGIPRARLRARGMLLIGAASPDADQTSLACMLLEATTRRHPVAAVRVTIVGQGHPDLDAPFRLSEETGPASEETARLLGAGARPVLWLRARPETLADAARALLDRLAPGPVLCVSNGLRELVEPDLYVIVRARGTTAVTPGAREPWELADAIVESGIGEPTVHDLGYRSEGWTLRRPASGVVLAGGRSSRMDRDKALLPFDGRPLVAHVVDGLRSHVDEVLVSANDASKLAFLGLPVIADREPDQGPLMAVASTLERARHDTVLYAPCDLPRLPPTLVARMFREARAGGEIIVPTDAHGRYEPLFAIYRRSALPELLGALHAGERQVFRSYDRCDTRVVPIRPGEELLNINTAADYAALLESTTR